MKKFSYLLVTLILLGFYACKSKKQDDDVSMFPDAEAVFLDLVKEYNLNEDGTADYNEYKRIKLLSYKSFHNLYGETFIVYNPEFQKLEIKTTQTYQSDGNIVKAPENAFNIVLPSFAARFPYANKLHEMVVTHTGLELNSIIEHEYSIKSEKNFIPSLAINEVVNQTSPIKRCKIIVRIPEKDSLYFELTGSDIKPQIKQQKGKRVYEWNFNNVPESSIEPHQGQTEQIKLSFTTQKLDKQLQTFIKQDGFTAELNDKIKKEVDNITRGLNNNFDKAVALQKYVVENIVLKDVPLKYLNFKIRTANEVFENNIALPVEKAVLLSKMLSYAGINNKIVVVLPSYLSKSGNINAIEAYLIKINDENGKEFYLLPTTLNQNNAIFNYSDKNIVDLFEPQLFVKSSIASNEINFTGNFKVTSNKIISGTVNAIFKNASNPYYKIKENKDFATSLLKGSAKSEVKSTTSEQSEIIYKFDKVTDLRERANYFFWSLPSSTQGIATLNLEQLNTKRETKIELPATFKEEYNYTIEYDKNIKPVVSNVSFEKQYPFGKCEIKITSSEPNKIQVKRMIEINKNTIDVSEYVNFREMLNYYNLKKYKEIGFKKI